MWVALFDFCLFLLFVSFIIYGLREWENLLTDPDEDNQEKKRIPRDNPGQRIALWVLVVGLGGISVLYEFFDWMGF